MALEEYNKKRNFSETDEPEGKTESSKNKLVFVVQRHAASRLHYDFRLEMDGVLKSWAVPKGPSLDPADKRLAMMVEDHPYSYRTFEGSIPKGNYGAGEVEIWDEGTYEPLEKKEGKSDDETMRADLHKQSLKFVMNGKKLKGEFALVKIKNGKEDNAWLLIKHRDAFAESPYNAEDHTADNSKVTAAVEAKRESSSKKKTEPKPELKLSAEKKLSQFIVPMLAETARKPFSGKEWAFEIKWDGYRAVADLRGTTQLYSRNGLSFNQKFKKIVHSLDLQQHEMVLDGELVAYGKDGKPDFSAIQTIAENPGATVVYQVFDILWLNGHSTESLNFLQRKELLKEALTETDNVQYHSHILESGEEFYALAEKAGLEGIMAKKTDSTYHEGQRTTDWMKIKIQQTDESVICGFTAPKGSRKAFGSLILGRFSNGKLVFAGHTGTGFSDKKLAELYAKMQPLITEKPPLETIPKTNDIPTWIKPELIAEIKFTELTKEQVFRHPVFLHLREDIDIEDLKDKDRPKTKSEIKPEPEKIKTIQQTQPETPGLQNIDGQSLRLTNPQKIYFPKDGITKSDIISYYQSVAEYILPYLQNRPESLNRFPNGIDGMSFYQKDAAEDTPDWIEKQKIFSESNGKDINYILCNSRAAMAYLNNLGCIEFNIWTSRIQTLDRPDYLVLDLDPSENNTFDDVIETALVTQKILDKAGAEAFCKTSGSSGIHIHIPMGAKYTFDQVKDFGHILMQLVQKELPTITTLERSLQKRDKGKIYLDYLQNRKGQTLASVYSIRPKNGAPVSIPLEWGELKSGLKPTDFNIENARQRIKQKGDIFKGMLGDGIDMLAVIEKLSV